MTMTMQELIYYNPSSNPMRYMYVCVCVDLFTMVHSFLLLALQKWTLAERNLRKLHWLGSILLTVMKITCIAI